MFQKVNPSDILTDKDYLWSKEYLDNATPHHDIICDYLQWKLEGKILDIGERNPLTVRLEGRNNVKIENSEGNLDFELLTKSLQYDTIICSHVIEHLFNPLLLLRNIKWLLRNDGTLYIITPVKPYWITPARCHFHEMDFRNFNRLIEKAGFRVTHWYSYSVPIPFRWSIRNWLRRFYKEFAIVKLRKWEY